MMLLDEIGLLVAAAVSIGVLLVLLLLPGRDRQLVANDELHPHWSEGARIAIGRIDEYRSSTDSDGDRSGVAKLRFETADGTRHRLRMDTDQDEHQRFASLVGIPAFPALYRPDANHLAWSPSRVELASAQQPAPHLDEAPGRTLGLILESQRVEGQAILDEWRLRRGLLTDHERRVLDNGMPAAGYVVDAVDTGLRRGESSLVAVTVEHLGIGGEVVRRATAAFLDDAEWSRWRIDDPVQLHYELDGPGIVVRPGTTTGAA